MLVKNIYTVEPLMKNHPFSQKVASLDDENYQSYKSTNFAYFP